MEPLELTAARLRSALTAQRFAETKTLLEDYCKGLEHSLGGLDPADPKAAGLSAAAHELFHWIRYTTLCLRGPIKTQLESIENLALYLKTETAGRHTWDMMG